MSCIRPATPGFLITLAATVCLAIVSFGVPILKSIFFLKASISIDGFQGDVTFGTLGYCLELSNGTTCSKPSVGYQLDINSLVGNHLPVQIPQVVVKWLTYALVLHIVALILSAASALFGLLAHVREMSMTCCSTFTSGLAASVALVAFIFDLVVFFITKARISAIGTASLGSGLWLTLAAWIMLFFSGCFFSIGRCCLGRRPRGFENWGKRDDREEEHRLDAIKAEADRKALQAKPEGGLPAFPHEVQPLTGRVDGDAVYLEPYKDSHSTTASSAQSARTGYAPAVEGTRAIDDFYHASSHQPRRQNSTTTAATSLYSASVPTTSSPPPRQHSQHGHYQSVSGYHQSPPQTFAAPLASSPPPINQYNNHASQYYSDPYGNSAQPYNHGQQASTYSTVPIHEQQPSSNASYSQYNDPFAPRYPQHQNSFNHYDAAPAPYNSPLREQGSFYNSPTAPQAQRSYTLGGGGYSSPPLPEHQHLQSPSTYQSPIIAPINTNVGYMSPPNTSPVKGPRPQPSVTQHEEAPPGYDDGTTHWAH